MEGLNGTVNIKSTRCLYRDWTINARKWCRNLSCRGYGLSCAVNYGMLGVSVFSVPTALIITVQGPTGEEHTRLHRVTEQKSNLGIVAEANDLSRRIAQTELTPNEALLEIDRLNRMESSYSPFEEFLAIAFICG